MPTYGYECTRCGAEFEVFQRITEEPLTEHDGCGGTLKRKMYPVGIVFKGPGFHVNDYAPKRNGKDSAKPEKAAEKSETTTEAPKPAKTETASPPTAK